MRTNLTQRLRAILRGHPDGLPVSALADMTNACAKASVNHRLHAMPDAYIDRWECRKGYPPTAIWCVVEPPPHCPKPETARRPKLKPEQQNTAQG